MGFWGKQRRVSASGCGKQTGALEKAQIAA